MRIALVNTNRMQPPISPVGLDYIAEALDASGYEVDVLDLCWEKEPGKAVAAFFRVRDFDLVGVTLRNTDDCAFPEPRSFLPEFYAILSAIRDNTSALIIVGGVGFSLMPEQILSESKADVGMWGEGEFVLPRLAARIEKGADWFDLPSLIYYRNDAWYRNPPKLRSPRYLPPMSRRWVDNPRYFRHGGQVGIETKRGCACQCVYCAGPVAKGHSVRARPPQLVIDEMYSLLLQEIDCFYFCDSEFNVPEWDAVQLCRQIISHNLNAKIRWYCCCRPSPFPKDLAKLMRRAGCVGINFGIDSGDSTMLKRLGQTFTVNDVKNACKWCKEEGIAVMCDLLIGTPGETKQSIRKTIELMKKANPDRVGVSIGVRVYPGTELYGSLKRKNLTAGFLGGDDVVGAAFFIDPKVQPIASDLVSDLIADDERFFFFESSDPARNSNCVDNELLAKAISEGHRGAYWDILRRISQ